MFACGLLRMAGYAEVPCGLVEVKGVGRPVRTVAYGALTQGHRPVLIFFLCPVPFLLGMAGITYVRDRLLNGIDGIG